MPRSMSLKQGLARDPRDAPERGRKQDVLRRAGVDVG